jgi:hypothetical protein
MPKFVVTLEEVVLYDVEVEADDEDAASTAAEELWKQSENPQEDFAGTGNGVEAINVEEIES